MNNPLRYIDPTGNYSWESGWNNYSWNNYGWNSSFNNNWWSSSLRSYNNSLFSNNYSWNRLGGYSSFSSSSLRTGFSSGGLFSMEDLLPTRGIGYSLMSGISSPFAQTSISAITKGAGAYFGNWAGTIKEYAPGWTMGFNRAVGFQSAFQGAGILQGSFGGKHGYYSIFDDFMGTNMDPLQAYFAIGIHSVGLMAKATGAHLGRMGGAWLVGQITGGSGAIWGGVGGAVVGGTFFSYLVDLIEGQIFRSMGIQ